MTTPDRVELRPAFLEDWLESLPYADFQRATETLVQALIETSQAQVKPAIRLELLDLYSRAYQYLLNAYIKGQAISSVNRPHIQQNIQAIREIVVELALGYRAAVSEALERSSSWWSPKKPPTNGILMGIKSLSHLLLLDYHAYAPLLPDIWKELHGFYREAEELGLEDVPLDDPERDPPAKTTIRAAYQQILATALVNPHRLPFGTIWEIYDQVHDWASHAHLGPYETLHEPLGRFLINPDSGAGPTAYEIFAPGEPVGEVRLLNCNPLWQRSQQALSSIQQGKKIPLRLSDIQGVPLLEQMMSAWGRPPARYAPRREVKTSIQITYGFNATYGMIAAHDYAQGKKVFSGQAPSHGALMDWVRDAPTGGASDMWECIDESPGGMAAYHSHRLKQPVRVGDLLGVLRVSSPEESSWQLGVVRWLIVEADESPRIGIQMLVRDPLPVAVRALQGSPAEVEYRRGFLIGTPGQDPELALITPPKLFANGRYLEIQMGERQFQVHAWTLREATVAFEHFVCTLYRGGEN